MTTGLREPVTTSPPRAVLVVVLVNAVLGIPGIIPVWLAWFYVSSWPLAELGVTTRAATEDDGVIATVVILPVVVAAAVVWVLVGHLLRPKVDRFRSFWFWPLSGISTLAPTLVLVLASLAS